MSNKIRVIVADDHAVVRKGVRDYLADEADIEVVAEAGDGAEVMQRVVESSKETGNFARMRPRQLTLLRSNNTLYTTFKEKPMFSW